LMYYEPFFQGRIYYNVLKLLETEVVQGSNVQPSFEKEKKI
jgi:hypothetical protein